MERNTEGRYVKGWGKNVWSRKYTKCQKCGTTDRKHSAHGYCAKCVLRHPKTLASTKKYRTSDKWKKQKKAYDLRVRLESLKHYGNGSIQCACCGEKDHRFLSFDHVGGGGRQHLLLIKGYKIGQWLRKHNYPKGFQILCHNCNMGKGIYGQCPHKLPDSADSGGNRATIEA